MRSVVKGGAEVRRGATGWDRAWGKARHVGALLRPVRGQLVVAVALLGLVSLGGVDAALHPTGNAFDRFAYGVLPDQWSQPFWHHVTDLGDPLVVAAGALLSAAWVVRRDRRRALTCIVAPLAAVVLCELIMKPLVGQRLGGVYSYPSGHVTAAMAMLLDVVVATPRRWRWVTASLCAAGSALVAVAVVADRQHYASDAVAALLLAPAVLLVVDGLVGPYRREAPTITP